MPITHFIQDGLLMMKAQGEIDFDAFYEAWELVLAEPPSRTPAFALLDLRDTNIDMSGSQVESIVSRLAVNPPFEKIAILAARGSFAYVIGHLFSAEANILGIRCDNFISEWKAKAWLFDQVLDEFTQE